MLLWYLSASNREEAQQSSLRGEKIVEALVFACMLGVESDREQRTVLIIQEREVHSIDQGRGLLIHHPDRLFAGEQNLSRGNHRTESLTLKLCWQLRSRILK